MHNQNYYIYISIIQHLHFQRFCWAFQVSSCGFTCWNSTRDIAGPQIARSCSLVQTTSSLISGLLRSEGW